MSLQSPLGYLMPEATLQVTCAAILNGTLVIQVCDELGPFYTNAQFAALYTCGGSSIMARAPMVRRTGATRTTARRLVP
jgi:hypothetical protein